MATRRPSEIRDRIDLRDHVILPRPDARTLLHIWMAVVCVTELCSGGLWQGLFTLPAAIITLMDVWHELRNPSRDRSR